jgi:hypothetical protein
VRLGYEAAADRYDDIVHDHIVHDHIVHDDDLPDGQVHDHASGLDHDDQDADDHVLVLYEALHQLLDECKHGSGVDDLCHQAVGLQHRSVRHAEQ